MCVVDGAAQMSTPRPQRTCERQLEVVNALGHGLIFEQRSEFVSQRQAEALCRVQRRRLCCDSVFFSASSTTSRSERSAGASGSIGFWFDGIGASSIQSECESILARGRIEGRDAARRWAHR